MEALFQHRRAQGNPDVSFAAPRARNKLRFYFRPPHLADISPDINDAEGYD
jgi:hypothetical protein